MALRVHLDRLAVDHHFNGLTLNQSHGCSVLRYHDVEQPISEIDFET